MKTVGEILPPLGSARPMREDEYLNEADGLFYCRRCRTPRQARVSMLGNTMTANIICKCQQKQVNREKEQRRKWELLQRIQRLKSNGLQDKALRDYTFDNDLGYNPKMEYARRYVAQWPEMWENGTGLLLWGKVGTGKSFFAGCIANALIDQGVPVLMTNFPRILNTLTGMYSQDKNDFMVDCKMKLDT
jgi:DNA replication protein DnaC